MEEGIRNSKPKQCRKQLEEKEKWTKKDIENLTENETIVKISKSMRLI